LLNQHQTNTGDYLFWNDVVNQQTNFFKWMRWLYRYSILHRNLLTHSRKITNFKKLLSTGFFSSNMTEQNLWVSNFFNTKNATPLLQNSWLAFYRSLSASNQTDNLDSMTMVSLTRNALPTLSNYEQSYFFYLHRFDFYNTLSNLTISSNLTNRNSTETLNDRYGMDRHTTTHTLHHLLKSTLVVNHDTNILVSILNKNSVKDTYDSYVPHSNVFIESDKSLLTNRSNIDMWLNLLEDSNSITGDRTLSYYKHTFSLTKQTQPSWSWIEGKQNTPVTQKPFTHPTIESLYIGDLTQLFNITVK
jgi:hypothetical protein